MKKFCGSDCSSVKSLHDLSSSRREPGWFLSAFYEGCRLVRKDLRFGEWISLFTLISLLDCGFGSHRLLSLG